MSKPPKLSAHEPPQHRPPHGEWKKFWANDYWREIYEKENDEYTYAWYAKLARLDRQRDCYKPPFSEIGMFFAIDRKAAEHRKRCNEAYEKAWRDSDKRSKDARRRAWLQKHIW